MKLILKNFRSFTNKTFSLDDDFILINGPSGAGKTSIFLAIIFAITGDGKKIVKHGHKTCLVNLIIDSLDIKRQKGPCRLIVNYKNKTYEDLCAQSIIDSVVQYPQTGYISQRLSKSFILATPQEKLNYIETLAFDKEYINNLNKKCKDLINSRKLNLAKATKERETMEDMLESLGIEKITEKPTDNEQLLIEETISLKLEIKNSTDKYTRALTDSQLRNKLTQELNEIQIDDDIVCLNDKISTLTRENYKWQQYRIEKKKLNSLPKPLYDIIRYESFLEFARKLQDLVTRVAKLKSSETRLKDIVTCEGKLASMDINLSVNNIESVISCLIRIIELTGIVHRANELDEKIVKLRKTIDAITIPNIDENDLRQLSRLSTKCLSNLERSLIDLTDLKKTRAIKSTCPVCHTSVGFWCGTLIVLENDTSLIKPFSYEDAEKADLEKSNVESEIHRLKILEIDANKIKFKYPNIDLADPEKILNEISSLKRDKTRYNTELDTSLIQQASITSDVKEYHKLELFLRKIFADSNWSNSLVIAQRWEKLSQDVVSEEMKIRLHNDVKELKSLETEYNIGLTELESFVGPIHDFSKLIIRLINDLKNVREYNSLYDVVNNLKCIKPTEDVNVYREQIRLKNIRDEKLAILETLSDDNCDVLLASLETYKLRLINIEKRIARINAYKQWKKVVDVKCLEKELNISLPRAVKLQSLILQGEQIALKTIIDSINVYSQIYLDRFIDGLSIELIFDKKLSMTIVHNGNESDLSSLSGGEMARVVIAYTMALVEIQDVGFIMFDESMASLDQDTTTAVLNSIRDNYKGKILCIAHQTVEGIFDKVIRI